jgi:sigma-B regulation protein RsbU (phosphoserine phosphatase)
MAILQRVRSLYRSAGLAEKLLLLLLALYGVLRWLGPGSLSLLLAQVGLAVTALVIAVKFSRRAIGQAIWRLRNRLVVTYVFIAVVPIVLILLLVAIGAYIVTGQVAVYLVTTELERRSAALLAPAQGLLYTAPQEVPDRIRWLAPYFAERYPGLELVVRNGREWRYPEGSTLSLPARIEGTLSGLALRNNQYYLWLQAGQGPASVVLTAPVTREMLGGLVPGLGEVLLDFPPVLAGSEKMARALPLAAGVRPPRGGLVPRAAGRLDIQIDWFSFVPVLGWEAPAALNVTSRPSAVLGVFFNKQWDLMQGEAGIGFLVVAGLFLLFVLLALWIGVSMTRTITGTVHGLYEATLRVTEGDFSHRTAIQGNDQLADLSRSFNLMTENLERLLRIEKEKERLQSEVEIAREVQNQLYPKDVPIVPGLELTASCSPARMVSGDYYDYLPLHDSKIALAIGDVAGKGISAALLMATVQASLRTQIRSCLESAASTPGAPNGFPTAAHLVTQLNQQLYAFTSAEKFATFYFGIYDDATGWLTYTNAGHPPPVLVRGEEVIRLETNGMVVGAFPFSEYGESRIHLEPGDLLVCFTDGITEPENEYGEMFGEDRLIELLVKHSWRKPGEIVETILEAVGQWTTQPEQHDDMTLLIARRL